MIQRNVASLRYGRSCLSTFASIIALTLGIVGISPVQSRAQAVQQASAAELTYLDTNGRIFKAFNKKVEDIRARPASYIKPGTKRAEALKILTRSDDAISASAASSYKALNAVKAPPRMLAMHQASLKLFATFRDTHANFAQTVRGDDSKKVEAAHKKRSQQLANAQQNLLQVTDKTLLQLGM